MKDAKDYIEETGPNTYRITSLAYWLTPEGMNNPIVAALLQDSIENETDEEFNEAFDGATKTEAAQHLEQWELCFMARWGAPELARAIILSDESRNEVLALRAVSMAQQVQELPEVFTPIIGIQWAMAMGYLIDGSICKWVGVHPGEYGHPSNPLQNTDTQPQAETVGDAGGGSQDGTEPAGVKVIQANSNEFEFSGLLNEPAKKDAWFHVIDDMTRAFHAKQKAIPNVHQAWAQLWTSPPDGYEITNGTDKGEDCLKMPGVKLLSKSAFVKRWESYTNKPE